MKKGGKHSEETKRKISAYYLTANPEKESARRLKISVTGKGRKSAKPMLGKKHTEDSKKKMSQNRKGKVVTKEHRKKLSESHKGQKSWNKGKIGLRGKDNPNWKGKTPLNRQIRACFEYRQWRSDCMSRDDFTCVFCFKRGGDLEVDHIEWFSKIVEKNKLSTLEEAANCSELWNINNGRTLCKPCHKSVTFGNNE